MEYKKDFSAFQVGKLEEEPKTHRKNMQQRLNKLFDENDEMSDDNTDSATQLSDLMRHLEEGDEEIESGPDDEQVTLTYIQRNVAYRFITGCIPHRSRLHRMMPAVFETHNCPVCLSPNASASHLLFDCPSKEKVWQGVIFEFLWPTTSISDIKEALLSLDFSNIWYCQVKGIRPYRILIISLSHIWLAHMRFVFDNVPVIPEAILENVRSSVR
ncbi:hypothetical protein HMPREF1544_10953 [Mucor circinelloides 1006PhL]|uniref:Reverse transcriptase zinc-binding domain-containing protein n=1 Tax=Mucor circinelloides f. circinelloides (strain 1006PhL) TaxID=1220926 RepID=S2JII6_MUCC1|nr:hypothetical protein HMPREF1544_10953 [Mucor circinelloides 1006PhL]